MKLSPHTNLNGHHQEIYKQQMVEGMWRGCALLMEMKTDTAIWKTLWKFHIKLEINLPYYPLIPLLDIYPEKTIILKDTYI